MTLLSDYSAEVNQLVLNTPGAPRYDEFIAPDGTLRPGWNGLVSATIGVTEQDLQRISGRIERTLADDGVTYTPPVPPTGEESEPEPWRLDPVPLVLSAEEWSGLDVGLAQRSELLNAVLTDLYGPQRLLAERIIDPALVFGHSGFLRVAARPSAFDDRQLHFVATDLGRNSGGEFVVTADRAQAPSGVGFALENRRVMARVFPDLYGRAMLHRMAPYFQAMRATLIAAAPQDRPDPRVVVLSPGANSETVFDQAFVASTLGFPLVEGSDLTMRDGAIYLRVLGKLERVDVILRRVDASFSDALELRKGSRLGVSGLNEAVRRGTVTVVNALGSGVVENPALMPYLPQISEFLLNEPLRIASVPTWWCGDSEGREAVLDQLDALVVRSIDDPSEVLSRAGETTQGLAETILGAPHRFVGQQTLPLSQAPALVDGHVTSLPLTLRTFTMRQGAAFRPLAGGLASVYVGNDPVASKDVWIAKDDRDDPDQGLDDLAPPAVERVSDILVPRVLEDLFWFGRYSERAEDLLRLVLTTHELSQESKARPQAAVAVVPDVLTASILRLIGPVLGPAPHEETTRDEILRVCLLDAQRRSTVAQSLLRARKAAMSVREQLSADTWHAFGDIERSAAPLRALHFSHQIAESAGRMLTGVLALSGVTANMMRDPGWHMIEAGRYIERSLQLAYLVRSVCVTRHGVEADRGLQSAVLNAAECSVTYHRRYRGTVGLRGVLDLLISDLENPRSLAFAVARLSDHLAQMPASTGSTRPERLLDDLREMIASTPEASLPVAEGQTRVALAEFLELFIESMSRFAEAVGDLHFAPPPPLRNFDFLVVQE